MAFVEKPVCHLSVVDKIQCSIRLDSIDKYTIDGIDKETIN